MRAPSSAIWLAILVSVPFAACMDPAIDPASAPDGPDSLLVGSHRFEQHSVVASKAWGHTLSVSIKDDWDIDESPFIVRVVPLTGATRSEQWFSSPRTEEDAFGRTVAVVLRQGRTLKDNETPLGQPPADGPVTGIAVGTGKTIFRESTQDVKHSRNGVGHHWVRDVRSYLRGADAPAIHEASLVGRVLHLGERLEFVREDSTGHVTWRHFTNYTVLRQEFVAGERTFVVDVQRASIPVHISANTQILSLTDTLAPGEESPASTSLLWVSYASPTVVKSEFRDPFRVNGKWYWSNHSYWRESYEAEGPVIAFGTTKEAAPEFRTGESPRVAPPHYLATSRSEPLTYPVAQAWTAIQNDPTLIEYVRFKADHPDAWPTAAYYVPDPANRTFTWTFGVQDAKGFPVVVSSRLSKATAMEVAVVANRMEDWRKMWPEFPGRPTDYRLDPMLSISDAVKASAPFRPAAIEPAVNVGPRLNMLEWKTWVGIDVVSPEDLRRGNEKELPYLVPTWSVTFDAYDGGLRTLNWTIAHALPSPPRMIPVVAWAHEWESPVGEGLVPGPDGVLWAVHRDS